MIVKTVCSVALLISASACYGFSINPTKSNGDSRLWSSSTQKTLPEVQVVSSMPDALPSDLQNKYFLLRHGQSTANVAGIISSARSLAYSTKHGVTKVGYEQGFQSANQLLDILEDSEFSDIIFVSSPFARAHQTAQACLDGLSKLDTSSYNLNLDIRMEDRLMERYFGRLDNEAIYTYAYVWPVDKFNTTHTAFGVESVAAVATRLKDVILDLEQHFSRTNIVLVSHADVLQICQLYGANADNVGAFSSFRFQNGEVREMKRTPDSLPHPSPLLAPERGTSKYEKEHNTQQQS